MISLPPIPPHVAALFVAFCLLVAAGVVATVRAVAGGAAAWRVAIGLALWLGVTGALGASGVLARDTAPPRFLAVVAPALLFPLWLAVTPTADPLLRATPPAWLVGGQVFRVGVELLLWLLAVHGALAEEMTFHGRNLDVLAGLTAPLAAWLAFGRGRWRPRLAVAWNVLALALLLNVVTVGLLSAPTPFRRIVTDPPNTVVVRFPTIWLVALLVPLAFSLHALSLRQLLRAPRRRAFRARSG
jgi:hypothetical protein